MKKFWTMALLLITSMLTAEVSPVVAHCQKCFQERKLVFLCLQNETSIGNQEALAGVRDFCNESKHPCKMLIVDPQDPHEQILLKQLNLGGFSSKPKTVLLSFPGKIIGVYEGPTDKDQFYWDLRSQCGCASCRSHCSSNR